MRKSYPGIFVLSAILIILVVSACGFELSYTKPSNLPAGGKPVVLILLDKRPQDHGGSEPMSVGNVRNAYGMPFSIDVDNPVPAKTIKSLVSDSLKSAGYEPVQEGQNAPELTATITNMWFDGYVGYNANLAITLELKRVSSSRVMWNDKVSSDDVETAVWGSPYDAAQDAYTKVMDSDMQKMIDLFKDQKFTDAYNSSK